MSVIYIWYIIKCPRRRNPVRILFLCIFHEDVIYISSSTRFICRLFYFAIISLIAFVCKETMRLAVNVLQVPTYMLSADRDSFSWMIFKKSRSIRSQTGFPPPLCSVMTNHKFRYQQVDVISVYLHTVRRSPQHKQRKKNSSSPSPLNLATKNKWPVFQTEWRGGFSILPRWSTLAISKSPAASIREEERWGGWPWRRGGWPWREAESELKKRQKCFLRKRKG